MSDDAMKTTEDTFVPFLQRLNDTADAIHDEMTSLCYHVRTLLHQRDVSDSEAAGVADKISELRDKFADAYDVMQSCETALGADDPGYRKARARLMEDFRQLNIIEREFDREKDQAIEYREVIPEVEPDDETDDELSDDDDGWEAPADEPQESSNDAETDIEAKRKKKSRVKQTHYAEQVQAEQDSASRWASADMAAVNAVNMEQERSRAEHMEQERSRAERMEQDARLARAAEEQARRDSVTRAVEPTPSQEPAYGYQNLEYGQPDQTETPSYHQQTIRELHEELVEKNRVVDADYTPNQLNPQSSSEDFTEKRRALEEQRVEPGFAPVGFTPAQPSWVQPPVTPAASSHGAAPVEPGTPSESIGPMSGEKYAPFEPGASFDFAPTDTGPHQSGADIMWEARKAVSGMAVPDISNAPIMSAAAGALGSYAVRDAASAVPTFVPPTVHHVGAYVPSISTCRSGQDVGAPVVDKPAHMEPTLLENATQAKLDDTPTPAAKPVIQAAFGSDLIRQQDGNTIKAPVASLATAAAAAGLQFRPTAKTEMPAEFQSSLGFKLKPDATQVYGIVSPDGKSVFLDTLRSGGAEALSVAYRYHAEGNNPATVGMFPAAGSGTQKPRLVLLAECDNNVVDAAQPMVAFAKKFQDENVNVILAGGKAKSLDNSAFSSTSKQVYTALAASSAHEILSGSTALHIANQSGTMPLVGIDQAASAPNLLIQKVVKGSDFTSSSAKATAGSASEMAKNLAGGTPGVSTSKVASAAAGKETFRKSETLERSLNAVVSESRTDRVTHALNKFRDKSIIPVSMGVAVTRAIASYALMGDESDNSLITVERTAVKAQEGATIARGLLAPITSTTTLATEAAQYAIAEKALYKGYSVMSPREFKALHNQQMSKVVRLTSVLENAGEAGAAPDAVEKLTQQLTEAKAELAKMNRFQDLQTRHAADMEVSKLVKKNKVIANVNGTTDIQKNIRSIVNDFTNQIVEGNDYKTLRNMYSLNDLVNGKDLTNEMFNLRFQGRDIRATIQAQTAHVRSMVGDKAAVAALCKKEKLLRRVSAGKASAADMAAAKGMKLTAQERKQLKEIKKLNDLLKKKAQHASVYNAHRKYMGLIKTRNALSTQGSKTLNNILLHRKQIVGGVKTSGGILFGHMLRAAATSGDAGAEGLVHMATTGRMTWGTSRFAARKLGLTKPVRWFNSKLISGVRTVNQAVIQHVVREPAAVVSQIAADAAKKVGATVVTSVAQHNPAAVQSAKATVATAKKGIAAVKKVSKMAVDKIAGSTVGKLGVRAGKAVASVFHAIGHVAGLVGAACGFLLAVVGWIIVLLLLLLSVICIFDTGKESNGKIDLSDYETYLSDAWADYQDDLKEEYVPEDYGCESVEWYIPEMQNNKKEILCMLKVRTEHQTDLGSASEDESDTSRKSPTKRNIKHYIRYMSEQLNSPVTNIDSRQRTVHWTDSKGNSHSETETYYVLQVYTRFYKFTGSGETFRLKSDVDTMTLAQADQFPETMRGIPFTEGWDKSNVELCELAYNMNWNDLYTGLSGIIGGGDDYGTVTETGQEILDSLPETLSPQRKAVVELALSLEGKVPYFWGGKSLTIGWDDRWGTSKKVTAPGSSSTGQYRPYGLDCSGFVDWVFYNASSGSYVIGHGGGARAQRSYCTPISWSKCQPGDLVFYPDATHVGIVVGKDNNGNPIICHEASGNYGAAGNHNVVVTGKVGFVGAYRPNYYGE